MPQVTARPVAKTDDCFIRYSSPHSEARSLSILILILLPLLLVEPLKLAALVIAGKGHWLAGTGIIIGAYATVSSAWNDFFGRSNRSC
jgi:hypothetical protein